MSRPVSVSTVRELDARASRDYHIPSLLLMENAGRGAAQEILARWESTLVREGALLVAGSGNNGGDAYVVARHLHNAGIAVTVVASAPPTTEDARVNHDIVQALGAPILPPDDPGPWPPAACLIDGLLGVGISGPPRPDAARLIEAMNRHAGGMPLVALDIPSGLEADTGAAHGPVVHATLTLTFGAIKRGLLAPEAAAHVGEVVLVGISLPRALLQEAGVVLPDLD